jgi:hypothetical protein
MQSFLVQYRYGGRLMLSANPVNITVTCMFSMCDVVMTTDLAAPPSMP